MSGGFSLYAPAHSDYLCLETLLLVVELQRIRPTQTHNHHNIMHSTISLLQSRLNTPIQENLTARLPFSCNLTFGWHSMYTHTHKHRLWKGKCKFPFATGNISSTYLTCLFAKHNIILERGGETDACRSLLAGKLIHKNVVGISAERKKIQPGICSQYYIFYI